jgi:hypothetical protein
MATKKDPSWTDKLYGGVNKPKSALQQQVDEMESTQPKTRVKPEPAPPKKGK